MVSDSFIFASEADGIESLLRMAVDRDNNAIEAAFMKRLVEARSQDIAIGVEMGFAKAFVFSITDYRAEILPKEGFAHESKPEFCIWVFFCNFVDNLVKELRVNKTSRPFENGTGAGGTLKIAESGGFYYDLGRKICFFERFSCFCYSLAVTSHRNFKKGIDFTEAALKHDKRFQATSQLNFADFADLSPIFKLLQGSFIKCSRRRVWRMRPGGSSGAGFPWTSHRGNLKIPWKPAHSPFRLRPPGAKNMIRNTFQASGQVHLSRMSQGLRLELFCEI